MIYLTLEQIFVIHDTQIEKFGGSHGLRDLALLESAIMRPQTTFAGVDMYESVFDKAAALMHSLILNHPFIDGNKRTGLAAALVFLELNGRKIFAKDDDMYNVTLKLVSKEVGIKALSSWLKKHSKKK